MNKTAYYTLWAGMFILCAGLSFVPEPAGFWKFFLIALSIGFFLPPSFFLKYLEKRGDKLHIRIVRNLAVASLALTIGLLLINFMSLMAPEWMGNMLYILLTIVSAPMICSQYWVLSLFGWACIMIWANSLLKKK